VDIVLGTVFFGGCGPWAVAGPLRVRARTAMRLMVKIFAFMADLLFMV
jgi:hypothetical protein